MSLINRDAHEWEKKLLGDMYGVVSSAISGIGSKDIGSKFDAISNVSNALQGGSIRGVGKEEMHKKYPNEIEYYACAFELLDSENNTVKFFSFPVMPSQIQSTERFTAFVQKTMAGVVVHDNPTFVPLDISLSGNFGRMFRKSPSSTSSESSQHQHSRRISKLGDLGKGVDTTGAIDVSLGDVPIIANKSFSSDYKTGYGSSKMLESILHKSKGLDARSRSHKVLFYNLSFNQAYVVNLMNLTFSQSRESNAIWQYSISMNAIAPISAVFDNQKRKSSIDRLLNFNKMNNGFSNQSQGIMSILSPGGVSMTKMRRILERQINSRAFNPLGYKQKSAITVIDQLSSNPRNIDDFIVNVGETALNTI